MGSFDSPAIVRYSASVILIWRLAELEARHHMASKIEPFHLLLGLCKSVALDLPTLVPCDSPDRDDVLEELLHEVRRLRAVFRTARLDARIFRRALRHRNDGARVTSSESEYLHRSTAAKQVFVSAGQFAGMTDSVIYPAHLLYAVVSSEDELRDGLLNKLGVDPAYLKKAAWREAMPARVGQNSSAGLN